MMKLILSLWLSFQGQALTLNADEGKTEFLAIGRPAAIQIQGVGAGPTGDLSVSRADSDWLLNGEVNVDLSSLTTDLSMRDRHMREKYLEVDKFKHARISFKDAKLTNEVMKAGGNAELPATLNLHGKDQSITVKMALTIQGEKVATTSRFKLKLSDFDIAIPTFAKITVADEVEVTVSTNVAKQALLAVASEPKKVVQ